MPSWTGRPARNKGGNDHNSEPPWLWWPYPKFVYELEIAEAEDTTLGEKYGFFDGSTSAIDDDGAFAPDAEDTRVPALAEVA